MVEIRDFANTCSARIMCNFSLDTTLTTPELITQEKTNIQQKIKPLLNANNVAVIVAITNSKQIIANKILKKLGFKSSKGMKKSNVLNDDYYSRTLKVLYLPTWSTK